MNKLSQYDIDRAKESIELEKQKMALEDARNAKTEMRLRRDSQGNYVYEYVAIQDENTQAELDKIAEAQRNRWQ